MFYKETQKILFLNPESLSGKPKNLRAFMLLFPRGGVRAILFTLIIVLLSRYRYKVASEQIHEYVM